MLAAAKLIDALKVLRFVMENICGASTSPVWLYTKAFLKKADYTTLEYSVNINHCGVPQNRLHLFAVGSKTATRNTWANLDAMAQNFLAHGPDALAQVLKSDGQRRPSVDDAVVGVKDS